jgi:hypothetical protein
MTNFQSMTKAPQDPFPNPPCHAASETHFPPAGNNPSILLVTGLKRSKGACVPSAKRCLDCGVGDQRMNATISLAVERFRNGTTF